MANKGGRPTKRTEAVVNKLEFAFTNGCSIEEACLYAGISHQTYHNWAADDEEFFDRIKQLRETTSLNARFNIHNGILEGDKELSKWYLERKKSQEFSTQQDLGAAPDNTGLGIQIIVDADKADKSTK